MGTESPTSMSQNCHCTGCHGHYKTNGHWAWTPSECMENCAKEDRCTFAMFNNITTKCYFYDTRFPDKSITWETNDESQKYWCYKKKIPPLTWKIDINNGGQEVTGNVTRKGGWSCDQVCQSYMKSCRQASLDKLSASDGDELFLEAFEAAGFNCSGGFNRNCEDTNDCHEEGSPYIENSDIADNKCWGGNKPNVGACARVPDNDNHRRLCPCV